MLNKKLFLMIFMMLFGSLIHSMNGVGHRKSSSQGDSSPIKNISLMRGQNNNRVPHYKKQLPQKNNRQAPANEKSTLDALNAKVDKGITWAGEHKVKALALSAVGGFALYKIFKNPIKKRVIQFRNFCEEKFLDALIKWEEVKENGFTRLDYIKGIIALLAAGCLGGTLYRSGVDNCKDQINNFFKLLINRKIELCAAGLGVALAHWLYTMKISLDNRQSNVLNFDKFLGQLTKEQRRIIFNSEDLLVAIGRGSDNHKRLLENEAFMELLTDTQKSYLQNIVRYRCSPVRI